MSAELDPDVGDGTFLLQALAHLVGTETHPSHENGADGQSEASDDHLAPYCPNPTCTGRRPLVPLPTDGHGFGWRCPDCLSRVADRWVEANR